MIQRLDDELRGLYGEQLLDGLAARDRWDVLEAMWLAGNELLALGAGNRLASSEVPEIVDIVVDAIIRPLAGHPSQDVILQMLRSSTCTAVMSESVLDSIPHGETLVASDLVLWLLRQPGTPLDEHALSLLADGALEPSLRSAAADRCSADAGLRVRAVDQIALLNRDAPDQWALNVELLLRVVGGRRVKGLASLTRQLIAEFLEFPVVALPVGFADLAMNQPADLLRLVESVAVLRPEPSTGATQLLLSSGSLNADCQFRVDLAFVIATHHPAFWSQHWMTVVETWRSSEWNLFLADLPSRVEPGTDVGFGALVGYCPDEHLDLAGAVRASVHLEAPAESLGPAGVAAANRVALRLNQAENDAVATLSDLEWPTADDSRWPTFRDVMRAGVSDQAVLASLAGRLLSDGVIDAARCSDLVAAGHRAAALGEIADDDLATAFVAAAVAAAADAPPEFAAGLAASWDVAVVRALAPTAPQHAFAHLPAHWEAMNESARDEAVELLEVYGATSELSVLQLVVGDTSGPNRVRRARAGQRWATLVPEGTAFVPEIASLLDTGHKDLARAAAAIARQVRPRDHDTLVALRHRWANADRADPVRIDFRSAIDAIDASLASEIAGLQRGVLVQQGPAICRALGVTAGPDGFRELTALVGPNARDDDVGLRRAAAGALREYFSAHPQPATEAMVTELGGLVSGDGAELDPTALVDLRVAFRQASLGEDAALAVLDEYLGDSHRMAELLGAEKETVVGALNGVVSRRSQGQPGWSPLVQQLDLVVDHVARAAYLVVGSSDNLKQQIRKEAGAAGGSLPYKRIIDGLRHAVPAAVAHMEVLHDIRSAKTEAHSPDQLATADMARAEDAFGEAVKLLYRALDLAHEAGPSLRVVEDGGA